MEGGNVIDFLLSGIAKGGFQTDDIVSSIVPLFQQIAKLHENGRVSPLSNISKLRVDRGQIWFENANSSEPVLNTDKINQLQAPMMSEAFSISGVEAVEFSADGEEAETDKKEMPRLLSEYKSWELEYCDHHDALTDIYFLGVLLASFALNLNFNNEEDFRSFKQNYSQLHLLNDRMHPVVGRCIREMTCLNRHDRIQDLQVIINRIIHYREQDLSNEETLLDGLESQENTRNKTILNRLRKRLYDFTRRNKLIFFKETRQALNLTMGSVPLMLHYQHLKPEQLLTWNSKLAAAVKNCGEFNLSDFLQYEDQPWIKKSLSAIRSTANRCMKEYGFSQLQVVACFLHWHNLKENKEERIKSPLLLLPVKIQKKKGVRDAWIVDFQTSEAIINPALREYLFELYGLRLPETFDLSTQTPQDLYKVVSEAITASEPSVSVNLLEKPRIKLLHSRAKKKLSAYQKRYSKRRQGKQSLAKSEYSYDPNNYNPLGLQLYQRYVKPAPLPFRKQLEIEEDHTPQRLEGEKGLYHHDRAPKDPYFWEFDLCSVTLGNFNYRKMTLVRDYNSIIDETIPSPSFEKVFSTAPRENLPEADELEDFSTRYHILPADPTQMAAVDHANKGISYIIQGPPGTGKSQTISNLIADYAARDKRVLFVCEKRAAIDVVYHRLSQCGLKDLCCLIHDSQEDKKSFVMDLKECYHSLSKEPDPQIESDRLTLCRELTSVIQPVRKFLEHQNCELAPDITVNEVVERLIQLEKHKVLLDKLDIDRLPELEEFIESNLNIQQFYQALKVQSGDSIWNKNPYSLVSGEILKSSSPISELSELLENGIKLFSSTAGSLPEKFTAEEVKIDSLTDLYEVACEVKYWYERQLLYMSDTKSSACQQVTREFSKLTRQRKKLEELEEKNIHWREKLTPDETLWALETARNTQMSLIRFLKPSWWKLKKILNSCYDFSQHRINPIWSHMLDSLSKEHETREKYEEISEELCDVYKFQNVEEDRKRIDSFREVLKKRKIAASSLENNLEAWINLAEYGETWKQMEEKVNRFLIIDEEASLNTLVTKLTALQDHLDDFDTLVPVLEDLEVLPDVFKRIIRSRPFSRETLEFVIGEKAFNKYLAQNLDYKRFDFNKIRTLQKKYGSLLKKLYKLNAASIQDKKSARFSKHLKICSLPAAQLTPDQKDFKKNYNKGRKELEHEFSKKMRYKSIRDLASDDSGMVLKDLKPIWLMSPLSVSDTIPLNSKEFDVVIFDEASQIVVEEAMPTLYRSEQFIVVGDEMQLPPTSFFAARKEESEEEDTYFESNIDSFLSLTANTLPSTLLGWHYRSRNELLISFSNAAFYKNSLLTVPEKSRVTEPLNPISADTPRDAAGNLQYVLDRPISFHFMNNGVYANRRNEMEADYIAQLVREYLITKSELSLGIVAFSEAQQAEIEASLEALAEEDSQFAVLYQQAQDREDEGQFNGIFVKNLENVQGDERDIMILSICYAPDAAGKMRMNFGPINQSGGEKRLNVIFTRSKRHIALVSSIKSEKITNDYNDGARCLKRYLQYADAVSTGNLEMAAAVLESIHMKAAEEKRESLPQYKHLQVEMASYTSQLNVGTSDFKAPLALGLQETAGIYNLALLDLNGKQVNASLEMGFIRPALLEAFGWNVITMTAKDILMAEDKVQELITKSLQKNP